MATVPPPPKVLASGTYIITQVATGLKVSRALAEDKSLGPKRVVLVKPAEASVVSTARPSIDLFARSVLTGGIGGLVGRHT